jgi:nuclear pore complex protein Nup54
MKTIVGKWDPNSPECAFQYYFYNSVKPEEAPFYGPQAHEDHKKWEEALANKPSEGSIPLLVRGFEEMAARIQYQVFAMNTLQSRLHEMNNCLGLIKDQHELVTEKRITQAKQKHIEHTQRILALATKVQILRNRGYAMDQTEEELKKKLAELEKKAFDPINGGRQEEIWARMSTVRERAQALQNETERMGNAAASLQDRALLSDDDQVQLEKVSRSSTEILRH